MTVSVVATVKWPYLYCKVSVRQPSIDSGYLWYRKYRGHILHNQEILVKLVKQRGTSRVVDYAFENGKVF